MKGISLLCSPRLCLCVMPYLSQLLPQLKFNDGKDEEETSTVPRVGRVGKSSPNLCLLEPVLPPKTETRSEGSRALYSTLLGPQYLKPALKFLALSATCDVHVPKSYPAFAARVPLFFVKKAHAYWFMDI